jgi:hypothetical protein
MNSNDFGVEVSDFAGFTDGFNAPRFTRDKREPISTDRRIGLNNDPVPDLAPISDADAGVEQRVIADCDIRPDVDVGDKPAMSANPTVWTDPAKWTNRGVLADEGSRINDGPRMYPGRDLHRALEKFCQLGQD